MYILMCPQNCWISGSVDTDQMLHFEAPDLGLHCLLSFSFRVLRVNMHHGRSCQFIC